MTRGAQRDRNREKTEKQKAKTAQKGNKEEGLTKTQRMERDAAISRAKQSAAAAAAGGAPVATKK